MAEANIAYRDDLRRRLQGMTLSPKAADFVIKAMDPVRGAASQIPDAIQVPTLNPQYVVERGFSAPGIVNWDMCVITPPSDRVAAYVIVGPAGIDFRTTVGSLYVMTNNPVVLSGNSQLAGAAVTTAGGVWVNGRAEYRSTVSSEYPAQWRTVARSLTAYATGSDLYNQGSVFAGQYPRRALSAAGQAYDPLVGQHVVVQCATYPIPLDESDMSVITPNFYTAPAKQGVYSVHRLTGPTQEFVVNPTVTQWRSVDGATMVHSLTDPTNANGMVMVCPRFLQDGYWATSPVVPPTSIDVFSSGFDDHCSWGVTIFRGLHPNATVMLKVVTNLELVPTPAAPSRQFILPPMQYEPTAISAYYALASQVPSCMSASHNFLGTILPILSSVASKVLPFLAPALASGAQALVQRFAPAQAATGVAPRRAASAVSVRSRASTRSARSILSRGSKKKGGKPTRKVRIARRK